MDPDIGEIDSCDILIEGERIVAVEPRLDVTDAEVIEGADMIAIPGLVDAHRHVWQTLARGLAADLAFRQYFGRVLAGLGPAVTPDDLFVAHEAGMLEAIAAGVTTTLDWSHIQNSPDHTDEIIRAHRRSGARVVFAYGPPLSDARRWLLDGSERHPQDAARVRGTLSADDALVTMAMGLRGPEYTPWETATDDLALARSLGLRSVFHVGDPRLRHRDVVRGLHERGLLGADLTFGNAFALDSRDIGLIGKTGGSVVTSPELGLQTGRDFPPLTELVDRGVPVGIGADMLAGYGGSPFSLMRLTVQVTRFLASTAPATGGELPAHLTFTDADVLRMATVDGARAIGLGDRVGSITPGKQADIVLLDTRAPNLFPVLNPVGLVVQYADTSNVDTVLVAGRVLKRGGRLLDVDLGGVRDRLNRASAALIERAAAADRARRD